MINSALRARSPACRLIYKEDVIDGNRNSHLRNLQVRPPSVVPSMSLGPPVSASPSGGGVLPLIHPVFESAKDSLVGDCFALSLKTPRLASIGSLEHYAKLARIYPNRPAFFGVDEVNRIDSIHRGIQVVRESSPSSSARRLWCERLSPRAGLAKYNSACRLRNKLRWTR